MGKKKVVKSDYDPETYVEKYWRLRREAEAAEKKAAEEIHKDESADQE